MLRKINILKSLLLIALIFGAVHGFGQGELYIFGVVKDYADSKKLENVKITVYENGNVVDTYTTSGNGKYEFFLDLGKEYEVKFDRKGLVSKKVYMDSRNIPEEDIGAGFSMNIEMSLFEEIEGLDIAVLDKPIGKAKYNPNTGALEFDFAYTQEIKDELNRLMREWEKGAKDKLAAEDEKQKELEALEKEFEKLVADADKAFLDEKYQESVADYKEALKLKPENPMVVMKLKSAEEKLAESMAAKVEEEKYQAALQAGDDFMRAEEYEKAIGKYEEALSIKAEEKYPQDQIADANAKIEQLKKLEEENARFNELVQKADNLVKAMDFDSGIEKYNEALAIKPKDPAVEEKLAAAEKAKADFEAQKELQTQYDNLVAQADEQFKSEDYETAISSYEEALALKPEEEHPKTRIEEARQRLEEIAAEQEEAARQKELEEQFSALVAAGNEHFAAESYNDAIGQYEEALALKPDASEVAQKIEEARLKIKEIEEREGINQQYAEAIEKGDGLLKDEDYQAALQEFEKAKSLKPEEAYPAEKIAEITNYLEEQERLAEEKRLEEEAKKAEEARLAEELARFNNLVESGDEFFSRKEYQKAIDQYEEALTVKPDNQHLPNKITEAQQLLDEMRKMQDIEQNYAEAIEEGDRKFTGQNYEGAIAAFQRALEFKPDESYPQEQIDAANNAIAELERKKEEEALLAQQQEEAERLKQQEADAAKLRAEFDQLVASGDEYAAEKEYENAITRYNEALALIPDDAVAQQKLADAQQLRKELLENREVDKQYNMFLADADAAYKAGDLETALTGYRNAVQVKPDETYAAGRISEIEETLAAQNEELEAQRQAELEAQQKREAEEAERLRLQQQQQELAALDEEYNTYIEVADRKLVESEYELALRNYQEALNLKPEEFYPQSKIQEIELLMKEHEERLAEEKRLAALEEEKQRSKGNKRRGGASVDSETEDEAERFMREARLREEAEKYDRIKRLKQQQQDQTQALRDAESERSRNYQDQVVTYNEHAETLYAEAVESHKNVTERVKNYKAAVESARAEDQEREREKIQQNLTEVEETEEFLQKIREGGEEARQQSMAKVNKRNNEYRENKRERQDNERRKNQKDYQAAREQEEKVNEQHERMDSRRQATTAEVQDQKQFYAQQQAERSQQEREQINKASREVQQQKEQKAAEKNVMEKIVKENSEEVNNIRETVAEKNRQAAEMAARRAKKAREEAFDVQTNSPKDYDDYYLSQLAQEYPQGVTEESDNVGNKVIIRRIVVLGNKADEYRKVIDKTGKYYFKNGDSISELTWNRETNPQYD